MGLNFTLVKPSSPVLYEEIITHADANKWHVIINCPNCYSSLVLLEPFIDTIFLKVIGPLSKNCYLLIWVSIEWVINCGDNVRQVEWVQTKFSFELTIRSCYIFFITTSRILEMFSGVKGHLAPIEYLSSSLSKLFSWLEKMETIRLGK